MITPLVRLKFLFIKASGAVSQKKKQEIYIHYYVKKSCIILIFDTIVADWIVSRLQDVLEDMIMVTRLPTVRILRN